MSREHNTTASGEPFDKKTIELVWQKRKNKPDAITTVSTEGFDKFGAKIKYEDYGNTNSSTGWEIDHIRPVKEYGTDDIKNLQPLQWENNRKKGDTYPNWEPSK